MRARPLAAALCGLFALAACGHSAKSLREARASTYDADFATVWNAVTETIHERFKDVAVEDPVRGVVATAYQRVQMQDETQQDIGSQAPAGQLAPGQTSYGNTPFIAFRMNIEVRPLGPKHTPPWRIIVDGESAEYKPGMAQLIPIKHGQADEPPWVRSRIDSATLEIHERLHKYAVKEKALSPSDIGSKTQDTTPWADLPDRDAVVLIGKVHDAALARDAVALRSTMIDDFRWGLGGEGSADTAVALWSADTSKLRELAKVIEDGCVHEDSTGEVVCPRSKGQGGTSMARFKKSDGGWKFAVFLTR